MENTAMSSNVYRVVLSGTALVDLDGSGQVTAQEWRRAFTRLDVNPDGLLTEARHSAVAGCGLSGRRRK